MTNPVDGTNNNNLIKNIPNVENEQITELQKIVDIIEKQGAMIETLKNDAKEKDRQIKEIQEFNRGRDINLGFLVGTIIGTLGGLVHGCSSRDSSLLQSSLMGGAVGGGLGAGVGYGLNKVNNRSRDMYPAINDQRN